MTHRFAPKSDFLRQRATSLHKSGYNPNEISRMLQISKDTAYSWLDEEYKKRTVAQRLAARAIARAEKVAVTRETPLVLPVLAFVPHIELKKNSKYQMMRV